MTTFRRIFMAAFLFSLPWLYYGAIKSWYELMTTSFAIHALLPFVAGVGLFFPCRTLGRLVFPRQWHFFATLEHELTHILTGILFLKIPVGLRVTAFEGGHARYVGLGSTGETWISLAPYFVPTLPIFVLTVTVLAGFQGWAVLLILGFGTSVHFITTWEDTHSGQTDIQRVGMKRAVAILPLMNLLSAGMILSFVLSGLPGIKAFLHSAAKGAYAQGRLCLSL